MKVETWTRVSALFQEALGLPSGERARLLERATADVPEVAEEVRRLLRLDAGGDDTVELCGEWRPPVWTPSAGAWIGQYRIVRPISSGGMGTVFEARQETLQRTVALKTLHFGVATRERHERFRFEVEALARLQHPSIAQVYEYGLHREGELELPYFAMELVAGGRDLASHAREAGLDRTARIELFIDVCEAVQHGHQRGVIHRDLKPSNVLVDPSGRPKVIDFGVARLADPSGAGGTLTLPGQIIGTLQYMSPEQLAGRTSEIGTQSDIYSLGCILYELLTGRLPYALDGLPLPAAARVLAETDPARPRELPQELGWILLACLAREPERRYASVAELVADLRRYSGHEPVLAGPPSTRYRLRKLLRRHRAPLSGALAVVAALLIGLARARSEARTAARETRKARSVVALLEDALTSASLFERGPDVRVVEMLEDTAPKVQAELADEPEARAIVDLVIGKSFLGLRRIEEAERHLDAAWRYAEQHLERDDPVRIDILTQRARHGLMAMRSDAEDLCLEAEALALDRLGPLHETTLAAQSTLAELLMFLGRFEEAERRYDELIARLIEAHGPAHGEVIACRGGRALLVGCRGDWTGAREELERVHELAERELPPGHFRVLNAAINLARAHLELHELERAETLGREILRRIEQAYGSEHALLWLPHYTVGVALLGQGLTEEGIHHLLESLRLTRGEAELDVLQAASVRSELAGAYLAIGDRAAAEQHLRAIVEQVDPSWQLWSHADEALKRLGE